MPQKAPGKSYRQGISILELTKLFPSEEKAEQWFIDSRWPQGVTCPFCDSDNIQGRRMRKPQPYRCRVCRKDFSVKTGTLMQGSNLGLQKWAIALYLLSTGLKGTSSMKLHRDLGITQKTAWHLAHRIRETWSSESIMFSGPIEVDETYIGGVDANKDANKKTQHGNSYGVKQPVVGMKSRETNKVKAEVLQTVSANTLQRFVKTNTEKGETIYSDQHRGYWGLRKQGFDLEQVNHSVKEYVNGQAHTNGIESFWALLKRGYHGTYHRMGRKHLQRYVNEFAGRHNIRQQDTLVQMAMMANGFSGKRLRYGDLIQ